MQYNTYIHICLLNSKRSESNCFFFFIFIIRAVVMGLYGIYFLIKIMWLLKKEGNGGRKLYVGVVTRSFAM